MLCMLLESRYCGKIYTRRELPRVETFSCNPDNRIQGRRSVPALPYRGCIIMVHSDWTWFIIQVFVIAMIIKWIKK